jgi:hypothetical protein
LSFFQIVDCARKVLLRFTSQNQENVASSNETELQPADWPFTFVERMCSWQEIVQVSEEYPADVLTTLLQCNEYEIAQAWSKIFNVTPELKKVWNFGYFYILLIELHTPRFPSPLLKAIVCGIWRKTKQNPTSHMHLNCWKICSLHLVVHCVSTCAKASE